LGDFNGTKAGQMVRHELTIQQFEATQFKTRDKPGQRHF
jgi:hypothetical protein